MAREGSNGVVFVNGQPIQLSEWVASCCATASGHPDVEALCPTVADGLLDLAASIRVPRREVRVYPAWDGTELARAALALRFAALPPATRFRAVVEEWDLPRIVREVW